jgi:anaerobic selenocysteine-containing dehydrogenase
LNQSIEITKRFGTCSKDCYGSCVFIGEWNDKASEKKLLTTKPLKNHPFTNNFFCPKFNNREELLYHPNRLKSALIRSSPKGTNSFKQISIQNALNLISEKLIFAKNQYSSSSIIAAYYAGNCGLISQLSPIRFFDKLGATITTGGICNEAGNHALSQIFGNYSTTNPFQIINPNNKLIVIWGSNLSDRNNHAFFLVKQAIKGGSKIVVINPVKTKLAKEATLHLQPFPGMDFLIVKYIINKILAAEMYDRDFLSQHVDNYDLISSYTKDIDKDQILLSTGLTEENLENFVELLFENQYKTLFIVGFGPQKYFYGGKNLNTIALIQILLGNFGKPGTGFLFSQSGFNRDFTNVISEHITQQKKKHRQNSFPLVTLGSSLNSNKYKMMFIYNFNPASSLPNQTMLRRALLRKDLFVVVLDMFLNETTKFADLVIPAKFDLECDDFITPYFTPGISITQAGPCPYSNCMSNYEFFQLLAKKCEWIDDNLFQETQKGIFEKCIDLLPKEIQQKLKLNGYYIPFGLNDIPYEDLNFPTFNGKIQIDSSYLDLFETNLKILSSRGQNEFYLLSPAHKYFIHSQMSGIHEAFENDFRRVFLNPADIKSLDLRPNEEVLVSNEFSKGRYILDQDNALKSGIALIYSGFPFANAPVKNVNFFTSEKPEASELSGAYFSTKITISKI